MRISTNLAQKKLHSRLLSLDVFRGLTIVLMIIVNSPGYSVVYPWLKHAAWTGCTLADLVFPFFIVIVGTSSVFSLTNLKNKEVGTRQLIKLIAKRSVSLLFMGLLLNALPNHFDFSTLRIFGVLQRIALCYFFSAILVLTTTIRIQLFILIALIIGYWLLITINLTIEPSINNNLIGDLDRLLFTSEHLYTPNFDPEGLLSTFSAIASVILGNLLGFCLISSRTKKQKLQWILFSGLILTLLGWFFSLFYPLNKSLWSSSYVLWTGGLAYLCFGMCFLVIEIKNYSFWTKPFSLFGTNAMLIYVLHVLFLKIQGIIFIQNAENKLINLRPYITDKLFHSLNAPNASFCYALTYTFFWFFLLGFVDLWFNKKKLRSNNQTPPNRGP